MKTYACDQCGATFTLEADDFDDVCPECYSGKTVLLSNDRDFADHDDPDDDDDLADDFDLDFDHDDPDFDNDPTDEDY